MASRGVSKILQAIETIQRYYNPALTVAGVLIGRVPAQGVKLRTGLLRFGRRSGTRYCRWWCRSARR